MEPALVDSVSQGGTYGRALQEAVSAAEHRANLARFHWITGVGILIWWGIFAGDVLLAYVVVPGPLLWYATIRLLGTPLILYGRYRTGVLPQLTPRQFLVLESVMFTLIAWGVSAMCVVAGGLTSPYVAGTAAIAVSRGVSMAQPWRRALPVNLAILLGHPLILAGFSLFRPELAAQWRDPAAVGTLMVGLALVAATSLLSLLGAHAHWALRREVLASRSVGRYTLQERLGAGGMGEVWRATVVGMKQDVALKLLPSSERANPDAIARFEREVAALGALHHPHTVRVFDYGVTEEGLSYYAMELLRGQDLAAWVRAHGAMPPARAAAVVRQVASALGEAHSKGIVHRDVKPQNIMLVDAGAGEDHAKLVDFGIARTADPADATRIGLVMGTPAYLSPEAAAGRPADARSDVYALGCVLFYLLTGTAPFSGDVPTLLAAHASRPSPSPSSIDRRIPASLDAIVARCLAKDPRERFASGQELAERLFAEGIAARHGSDSDSLRAEGAPAPAEETLALEPMVAAGADKSRPAAIGNVLPGSQRIAGS